MAEPKPLFEDPWSRLEAALTGTGKARVVGLSGAARGHALSRLASQLGKGLLCVCPDEEQADQLARDLAFFLGGPGTALEPVVLRLPADGAHPYDELAPDRAAVSERLGALFQLNRGAKVRAVVVSQRALHRKLLPPAVLSELTLCLRPQDEPGRDALALRLVEMGYQSVPLVEDVGAFSVRGDLIDVFPPLYEQPVRIELFGDSIEAIRRFDAATQRTVGEVSELWVIPPQELFLNARTRPLAEQALRDAAERVDVPTSQVRERIEQLRERTFAVGCEPLWPGFFDGGLASLFDYLERWERSPLLYLDQPGELEGATRQLLADVEQAWREAQERHELALPPSDHFVDARGVNERLTRWRTLEGGGPSVGPAGLAIALPYASTQAVRDDILAHHGEEGALTPLVDRLVSWRDSRIATAVACGSMGQADRLRRLLLERKATVRLHEGPLDDPHRLYDPSVLAHLFLGEASAGFIDAPGHFALLTDEDIFGVRARRKVKARRSDAEAFAAGFRDLKEGDIVVHTDFGIARYGGLTKMELRGIPGDFLVLEYAGKDKVYLPVSRMRLIQKFTGADPTKVELDRLGSESWENTKRRVKEHLLKLAAELVQLYAARKAHPGTAFSGPDRYFRQFEADFEFEETTDQQKAIDDVLADMQKPEPMDRLVCGDVGYGKTEVAMRAAFKAVLDRKQVAMLVPTTLLAQQHYLSFMKRLRDYPVTVEVVSRMKKPNEVREVLRRAREGRLDILIGTHKLLGTEVAFKDLGLLVIDEEQRFGVKHKEALKRLRTQVDTLTLTATPIPRTLHMAMSGLRDMSIIATPPQDRRAIRTFVIKFDPVAIREAVERELARGGQVFFVHNRVSSIRSMEKFLHDLLPQVSIGVAHGQMNEGELERVMLDFVEKRVQLLLCTSIIESGIDIPSANTMIVSRADAFGLAQLYQLRGRVGRSHERAYAYLLVPARRTVTREAQRRLEVLQRFTELGAGFQIASHDLEIRGAGNLLGPEQSGSIEAVGFDLYTQLLDEAVREMRGEPPRVEVEPEVNLPLPALIPDDYVPDVHQRLVLYKRFSNASTPDDLDDLRAELADRFGELPDEVDHLCQLMTVKMNMRELGLRSLESGPGRLVLTLGPTARIDGKRLLGLVERSKGALRLTPELKLIAKLPEGTKNASLLERAQKLVDGVFAAAKAARTS